MAHTQEAQQAQILDYLHLKGKATITELCALLDVEAEQVWQTIDALVADGRGKRLRDGVALPDSAGLDPPVVKRRYLMAKEKQRIATATAALIQDGETVFLGNGSTVLEVAEQIKRKKNLTVITNSLPIATLLTQDSNLNVIMTGGFIRQPELSLIGHLLESSLEQLRADKVVMSFQGIHLKHGLTNNSLLETTTDRAISNFLPKIIVAADHTKCNQTKASFIAGLEKIETFITDEQTPAEFVEALRAKGIQVIIATDA